MSVFGPAAPLQPPQRGARGMRVLATTMLALMASIFIAATNLESVHPVWGFVRAFAEAAMVADILEALDEEQLGGMVRSAVAARLRAVDISPLLGRTLEAAMTEDRHVPIVDAIVTWAGRTLDANEDLIREMVHKRAGWI